MIRYTPMRENTVTYNMACHDIIVTIRYVMHVSMRAYPTSQQYHQYYQYIALLQILICVYIYIYAYVDVCISIYIYIYIYMSTHTCRTTCTRPCRMQVFSTSRFSRWDHHETAMPLVCMYIYIYYTHMYAYVYIYIYTHTQAMPGAGRRATHYRCHRCDSQY